MNDTDRVVDRTPWRIAVAQALAICGVAAAVAVGVNWTELRTGNFVPLESSLERVGIEVPSLLKEYGRGRAVVIDTRSRADYEHGHIAGAIHSPVPASNESTITLAAAAAAPGGRWYRSSVTTIQLSEDVAFVGL